MTENDAAAAEEKNRQILQELRQKPARAMRELAEDIEAVQEVLGDPEQPQPGPAMMVVIRLAFQQLRHRANEMAEEMNG